MNLPHNRAHCAGRWERQSRHVWQCDTCGATAKHTASALEAIAKDNFRAYCLAEYTREGRQLIEENQARRKVLRRIEGKPAFSTLPEWADEPPRTMRVAVV